MIKYHIEPKQWTDPKISPVKVSKESLQSIWIEGHGRCAKRSEYAEYYDTFDDAKVRLSELATAFVAGALLRLDRAEQWKAKAEALTEAKIAEKTA